MKIQEALRIIDDLVTCEMEWLDDDDENIIEKMQELQEAWDTIQLTINKVG
tara:strand:- start:39 stop:191 length:153 start_codon:yes stop_codon:yes gene_type:complete